jgi:hypothetical protein
MDSTYPHLPSPLPRPSYIVVHNGPAKVGDKVLVIPMPDPDEPVDLPRFTLSDGGWGETPKG